MGVDSQQLAGRLLWRGTGAELGVGCIRQRLLRFRFTPAALFPCYGLSEATLLVSGGPAGAGVRTSTPSAGTSPVVSGGRLPDSEEIAIVDPESTVALGPQEIGEIWVRGAHVGAGYWRRPDETRQTFEAQIAGGDGHFYLRTGDLGFRANGELHVTGRIKDLLIVRGKKHHPEELEATLAAALAGLGSGLRVAFAVEAAEGSHIILAQELDRHDVNRADLGEAIKTAFGAIVEQHGIRVDDILLLRPAAIARTTSGKVQRHRCKADFEAGRFQPFVVARLRAPGNAVSEHEEPTARRVE